jgi:thiol-disulfide isomerase/thioredoxin
MALWEFDWAPDQRAFLFSQRAPLNPTTRSKALQVDRETGRTTAFGPNNDRNQFLRWLPDMKSIVFLSAANGVVMRDVTSGAERTLFQKADRGPLDSFSVSPDGRRIAIDVRDRETRGGSLTVIDVAEGGAKEIAALPSWNRLVNSADLAPVRHTFSGDGRHVLFLTNPDGKPDVELWRVAIDGGERQRLGVLTTDPNEHIHRLSARRTGDALAFELIRIEPPATFVLGASTALSAITAKRAVIPKPAVTPKPGRPPAPTAEAILAPAFERAKKESKNVLIDFSAKTWCVPCFQLRYFLTAPETSRILNHHFVVVELVVWENRDNIVLNNVGAEALMQQWDFSGGIPFVVFADPARRVLATSVSGTSFGGYPASAQQIDAFAALLPTVAPRMTEAERAVLVKWLREASVRLDFERPGSARRKW